ncbi:MAG: TonB-dependent receptor [Deltaproteobacteria bacterium]|nr:TonB-dependent receptor [Deltaproteobacteria bacterium]
MRNRPAALHKLLLLCFALAVPVRLAQAQPEAEDPKALDPEALKPEALDPKSLTEEPRGWDQPPPGDVIVPPSQRPRDGGVEAITVTAQKRVENIQDVPISITALTAEFIEDSGLTNVLNMAQYLPNVQINAVTDSRSTAIRIRGIGSDGNNAGIDPSVGVFIDGIFQGRTGAASIVDLSDIERIEVLRGPQGTLYGKNTAAGAINVVSKRPVLNEWEGLIEGIAANYSNEEVRGSINVPLIDDRVAARVSGYWVNRDPFDELWSTGAGVNDANRSGARLRTLFDISDDLELLVWADYGNENSTCCVADIIAYDGVPNLDVAFKPGGFAVPPGATVGFLDTLGPVPPVDPFDRMVDANAPSSNDVTVWGVAGELNYDIGDYVVTWLNAYRTFDSFSVLDGDFSSFDAVFQQTDEQFQQASSELRLTSPYGEDLEYVVGLYFYWQKDDTVGMTGIGPDWLDVSSLGPILEAELGEDAPRVVQNTDTNTHQTFAYAAFGQGTYHFSEEWSLTIGLRGTYEQKDRVGSQIAGFTAVDAGPFGPDRFADESFSVFNLSPMGSLQYFPTDDSMIFARVARGFKSGGFNQLRTVEGLNTQFDDEVATDFEIGFRSTWWDGMVTVNATGFYTLYDDFQAQAFDGNSFAVTNAGSLTSYGVETDALFVPHPMIVFGLGTGYNVAKYDDFPNAPCTAQQAYLERLAAGNLIAPTGCKQDLSGQPLDNAPQWSISSFAQLTYPIGELPLVDWPTLGFLRAEYNYRDVLFLQQDLDEQQIEPPLNLVNLRAGLRTEDEHWELTLWVMNLTDADYQVVSFDVPIVSGYASINGPPRTFGATLRYNFF